MNTQILFFGSLADRLGSKATVEIPPEGCTVAELRDLLGAQDQAFGSALAAPGIRASVDKEMAGDGQRVLPGQEIAFFPILSGG